MPIYTFESSHSAQKIAGKTVMVDTSYLIDLSQNNQTITDFHQQALTNGTVFYFNVVVRNEFIKQIRKVQLIQAIIDLLRAEPQLEKRYRDVIKMTKVPLTAANLSKNDAYNKIYKDHVRKADIQKLIGVMSGDIWQTVEKFETQANITYLSGTSKFSWEELGNLMQIYCFNASDAMIANVALTIGADAIVTTDCDFAQLADLLDVYMPGEEADKCANYKPEDD